MTTPTFLARTALLRRAQRIYDKGQIRCYTPEFECIADSLDMMTTGLMSYCWSVNHNRKKEVQS